MTTDADNEEQEESPDSPSPTPDTSETDVSVESDDNSQIDEVSASDLGPQLVEEMPEVQPHAVEQADEASKTESAIPSGYENYIDTDGNNFNPDIHLTNDQGQPLLTKNNKLRKKRGRRKITAKNVETNAADLEAQAAGKAAADALVTIGMMFGGNEWEPVAVDSDGKPVASKHSFAFDEKANLDRGFTDYFKTKGVKKFPAEISLVFVILAYVIPRMRMPNTLGRWQKMKANLAGWWAKRRASKKDNKAEVNANES